MEENEERKEQENENKLEESKVGETVATKNIKKKSKAPIIIPIVITIIIVIGIICILVFGGKKSDSENGGKVKTSNKVFSEYSMQDNTLSRFDLSFLKFENNEKNMIYSPLSIKYALAMLKEGADGETKSQIEAVIGEYLSTKYENNKNMSFANAIFINEDAKDMVKSSYTDDLKDKYNAEVIYDPFTNPTEINKWVKNKTFDLIDNLVDDVEGKMFVLVNALAIDMEWVNKIQPEYEEYNVNFDHENFYAYVPELMGTGFHQLDFKKDYKAESLLIAAVANKYDIVSDIGEDNIRKTVGEEYKKWLQKGECDKPIPNPSDAMINEYLDKYMKEIGAGYKHMSSSTDFMFYDDDDTKVFAKDLKEYNGTTLQYVAIMPKNISLKDFINDNDAKSINTIINNAKSLELDSFEDGYITKVEGAIPTFKYEYELKLMEDLQAIGITDVFDSSKADLSGITGDKSAVIDSASHKANIEFSNNGIKAGAATSMGGKGNMDCVFDYVYDVPTKTIDITFDNPYLFLIRDKNTKEVWFVGTVYEPKAYQNPWER